MAGYAETYLRGLQQMVPMRRMQDAERAQEFRQRMFMEEEARRREQMNQLENHRQRQLEQRDRLREQQAAAEAQQRSLANEMRMMGLRLQEQGNRRSQEALDQPSYGDPEELIGADNKPVRVMRDRKTGASIYADTRQPVPSGTPLRKKESLSSKELEDFRTKTALLTAATRAMGLQRGEVVEGVKGDKTAVGWEGYVPDWLTLVPGVLQGMGGKAGLETRRALAGLNIPIGHEFFGGAFTPSEAGRLRAYEPSLKDPEEAARTKTGGYITELSKVLEENLAQLEASGKYLPIPLKNRISQQISRARSVKRGTPVAEVDLLKPEDLERLDKLYGRPER